MITSSPRSQRRSFSTARAGRANYILGAGADARVSLGVLLEMILIIDNVDTAVVQFREMTSPPPFEL